MLVLIVYTKCGKKKRWLNHINESPPCECGGNFKRLTLGECLKCKYTVEVLKRDVTDDGKSFEYKVHTRTCPPETCSLYAET
jgi:hypothetical protein